VRKEFFGPLPVAIGVLALVAAALAPTGPPPPDCPCQVLTPDAFARLDGSGYAGVEYGDTLVVDGRVVAVAPPSRVEAPYHLIRFEGAAIEFNVTQFDGPVPFEGAWARLQAVHQGQRETGGPDTGHRWRFVGLTAPPGDTAVPLAGYSVGLALVLWGAATFGTYRATRAHARAVRARVDQTEEEARAEPGLAADPKALLPIAEARRHMRRGQYASAEETLHALESRLARAQAIGKMVDDLLTPVEELERRVGATGRSSARAARDEAVALQSAGDLDAAEEAVDRAVAQLRAGSRAAEVLSKARALARGPGAEAGPGAEEDASAARAAALLAQGAWSKAEADAAEALAHATAASPEAQSALRAIEDLEDAVQTHRAADAPREVAGQLAEARSAYAAADFARARALADAARWVADPGALDDEGLRTLLARRWGARGWRAEVGAGRPPNGGVVFAKGDERVLVLTAGWREFPTERVLLAAKDFLRAGHASSARVYSSAFANTSTDPAVVVVTARELLRELVEAAESRPGGG
jgi:hypothetical protein